MAQDFRPRVSLAVIVLAPHPSPVQAGAHRKGGTTATPRHRHLSAEPTDVDTIHPRAARQPRRETGSWELDGMSGPRPLDGAGASLAS